MKKRVFLRSALALAALLPLYPAAAQPNTTVKHPRKHKKNGQHRPESNREPARQKHPVHATLGAPKTRASPQKIADVHVYKKPALNCCSEWSEYLRAQGFSVEVSNVDEPSKISQCHGMSRLLRACHTAVVNGYVIEGHVPAEEIKRLIRTKPAAIGLAVPGMPFGAPGLGSYIAQPFNVVLLRRDGHHVLYRHYSA